MDESLNCSRHALSIAVQRRVINTDGRGFVRVSRINRSILALANNLTRGRCHTLSRSRDRSILCAHKFKTLLRLRRGGSRANKRTNKLRERRIRLAFHNSSRMRDIPLRLNTLQIIACRTRCHAPRGRHITIRRLAGHKQVLKRASEHCKCELEFS